MLFKLEIDCDNDAFSEDPYTEVARILRLAAKRIEYSQTGVKLFDINGNHVGKCVFGEHE